MKRRVIGLVIITVMAMMAVVGCGKKDSGNT